MFVFIELSSVLPLLVIDIPQHLQKKLIIVDESAVDEILSQDEIKIYITKGQYRLFPSLAVTAKHVDDYNTLLNDIESKLQNMSFQSQIDSTQKIFIHTQLANISDNHTQAKILKNTFSGQTCIFCGRPSLDENIDWIYEIEIYLSLHPALQVD
ncbi:MAG: hypothetical protein LC127_01645 [Chitinophagales bacterium]|nr:hypothetical protein [Chitinophagales bacterium]